MLSRLKLRIGAILMILGGLVAGTGEGLLVLFGNPASGYWYPSIGAVLLGTLLLLYGANMFAQQSQSVGCIGLVGIGLLFLGGLALVLGTVIVDAVILPLLTGIASFIDHIPLIGSAIHTFHSSGTKIVNDALSTFHLPSNTIIGIYGHFFLSGTPLILGCLVLGLGLLRATDLPRFASFVLIGVALLNAITQPLVFLPLLGYNVPVLGAITSFLGALMVPCGYATSVLLFLSVTWLGVSVLFPHLTNIQIRLPHIHLSRIRLLLRLLLRLPLEMRWFPGKQATA